MCQYLPTGGFEWVTCETESTEYWTEFILNQRDEQDEGYIFQCDLEYPRELHDKHDNFPLAPIHLNIQKEMLSSYQKDLADELKVKVGGNKLCLTLENKNDYICHYRNLKYYLEQGMVLKRVKQVLKFNQSKWLAPYIELNTLLRQKSTNTFEKDFFKLMNNSFFGKTCEDVRRYKDVKIAMSDSKIKKTNSQTYS